MSTPNTSNERLSRAAKTTAESNAMPTIQPKPFHDDGPRDKITSAGPGPQDLSQILQKIRQYHNCKSSGSRTESRTGGENSLAIGDPVMDKEEMMLKLGEFRLF
ncbi:hypothetical protein BGZ95_004919 [Linnemannia exigua]|uniref:Uncharacterized protein n=1 Tax=Linnemannia exigua TaxID=604196 RepID=A0AAD4H1F5_9FUNG|nr:hypothetical protein BGZ95_004919 [Linnemannia exigua]